MPLSVSAFWPYMPSPWVPSSTIHAGRHAPGLIAPILLAALRSASWKAAHAAATSSINAWCASVFFWSSVQSSSPRTLSTKPIASSFSCSRRSACGLASWMNVSRASASDSMSVANSSAVSMTGWVEENSFSASGAL
ncbi:hypothetical protein AB0D16_19635 [Streptomyces sp. NPDC048161]|uniref:hypothetical protein n=1 Tax=Streptomyces sp. NPDC048161 TaxID=3160985 RepID=UPI003408C3E2